MSEFSQSQQRQTPATNDLRAGAINKRWTHSGDLDLRRHVLNATAKESGDNVRIAKQARSRTAPKIDLCTALMMAHSRCTHYGSQRKKRKRVIAVR
jgi:phage terminase large subunit-like protein